jgi:hypothetical protein
MDGYFTAEETWLGGFYELAMEFGTPERERLETALQALWQFPGLQGCYLGRDVKPAEQACVRPALEMLEAQHLFGIATLPNGKRIACGTCLVREDNGPAWLIFYLPLGALATAYAVGAYPVDDEAASREWRAPLEEWLAQIGQEVYAAAAFRFGLVGWEVSWDDSVRNLESAGVPARRFIGYLYPSAGTLTWHPTNQWHQQPLRAS